jgi:diketogulonate reductase-like aldo/keto reductase
MTSEITRRTTLGLIAGAATLPTGARAETLEWDGTTIPKIGMGTWQTFDVPPRDEAARLERVSILRAFFEAGGRFVDSSPMYGMSEDVLGFCLDRLENTPVIAASKVWIAKADLGAQQIEASRQLWQLPRLDVVQVHNLLQYDGHIETLRAMKAGGDVVKIGISTSHGRRHADFARIMETEDSLDTVQFTYNIADREAEARLLPLAAERGLTVIINRPFRRGALIDSMTGRPLPGFAADIGVKTWPQFFLKWVISHPAVTVAIPATSKLDHMKENMAAMAGPMPDAAMRRRMVDAFEASA